MAWLDDRAWAHPKFTDLSDKAFRVWAHGLCYSSGFETHGYLSRGQLATIGAKPTIERELTSAGLWEERDGMIYIHEWAEHNGKRDARRAVDRERKRQQRALQHG